MQRKSDSCCEHDSYQENSCELALDHPHAYLADAAVGVFEHNSLQELQRWALLIITAYYNHNVTLWPQSGFWEKPVRLSISARVSIACTSVIVMALALLAIGLSVSNKIHQADLRITRLSEALGREDQLDQAQRRLRQDIGFLTRDAERGVKVSDARWRDLRERIADFKRRSSQTARLPNRSPEVRSASIQEVQQAAAVFAKASETPCPLASRPPCRAS